MAPSVGPVDHQVEQDEPDTDLQPEGQVGHDRTKRQSRQPGEREHPDGHEDQRGDEGRDGLGQHVAEVGTELWPTQTLAGVTGEPTFERHDQDEEHGDQEQAGPVDGDRTRHHHGGEHPLGQSPTSSAGSGIQRRTNAATGRRGGRQRLRWRGFGR